MSTRRILGIGVSSTPVCGVRDAAEQLTRAFRAGGADASTAWCELAGLPTVRERRRLIHDWLNSVTRRVRDDDIDAVILHYSVFAYGLRGFPLFVPAVARELAAYDVPVIGFLHEFVYPFGRRGWRGATQALSHRLALFPVVRCSDGLAVTTERRAAWIRGRRWLPRRPVVFVPVFSNLPRVLETADGKTPGFSIGVIGFGSPGTDTALMAEAIVRLGADRPLEIVLIGSPGSAGPAADSWRAAFRAQGCADLLRFTGVRTADEIAHELGAVDLVVFPERAGPDSRRGTLAAALAAGKAVVALNGPERWERLVSEAALVVVEPRSEALAAALVRLLEDPAALAAQGAEARAFYRTHMAPEIAVERLSAMLPAFELQRPATLLQEIS
jgi:glycosyltransferase involved in cell wall biosynthesis